MKNYIAAAIHIPLGDSMKISRALRVLVCYVLLLLIATSLYANIGAQSPLGGGKPAGPFPSGWLLFAPVAGSTTYLMDSNGTINHTWPCTYTPQLAPYWIGNGSIVYPINNGGGLEKIAWNGTVTWTYQFNRPGSYCHHDIVPLPNGDVLMIVQEVKTHAEAVAAGRNPATVGNEFLPDYIIEVKPTGPASGTIVWEWHQWDHLIQDYDSSKQNYGVVGDHPELIDINFGEYFTGDWIHTNSVDYNPKFDQILISAHDFDEVWIIDHSTTTQEAAGHTGGRYGHGGDLLYRWGNPKAYRRGDASDEKLFFQHQCTWIKPGLPGAGDILIYDNGNNRPGGPYSTADEFTPTVTTDGYYYIDPGKAYGPDNYTWRYVATPPQSMVLGHLQWRATPPGREYDDLRRGPWTVHRSHARQPGRVAVYEPVP